MHYGITTMILRRQWDISLQHMSRSQRKSRRRLPRGRKLQVGLVLFFGFLSLACMDFEHDCSGLEVGSTFFVATRLEGWGVLLTVLSQILLFWIPAQNHSPLPNSSRTLHGSIYQLN